MDATRLLKLTLVLALVLALSAPVGDAKSHNISRAHADSIALRTLQGLHYSPVVLFRLPSTLPAGTRISVADGGSSGASRLRARAWFYWVDLRPNDYFDHTGSIVAVDARTGRVLLHEPTMTWPLVNGKTPAFLRSASGYNSSRYRVLARGGGSKASIDRPSRPAPIALAAAGSGARCMIIVGPPRSVLDIRNPLAMFTFGGHLNDADEMALLAQRMGIPSRRAYSLGDLQDDLSSASAQGCTDVLVFLTGEGSPTPLEIPPAFRDILGGRRFFPVYGNPDPNVELAPDGRKIYAKQLEKVLQETYDGAPAGAKPNYTVMIQECYGGRMLDTVDKAPGVTKVATSSSPTTTARRYPKGIPQGASPWVDKMVDGILKAVQGAGGSLPWGDAVGQAFNGLPNNDQDAPELDVQGKIISKAPTNNPPPVDNCASSPQPCFIAIEVDGYGPGDPQGKAGDGVVTVSPGPTDCTPNCTFGANGGGFPAGSWGAQFNDQVGCANGYTDVNLCHDFEFPHATTVTLNAFPAPKGGYGGNSPPESAVFAGWGGDCAAAGTSTTCTLQVGTQRPNPNPGGVFGTNTGGQSGYSLDVIAYFAATSSGG